MKPLTPIILTGLLAVALAGCSSTSTSSTNATVTVTDDSGTITYEYAEDDDLYEGDEELADEELLEDEETLDDEEYMEDMSIDDELLEDESTVDAIEADGDNAQLEYVTFNTGSGEGFNEYMTFFYGIDTRLLTGIIVQTNYDKAAGYTEETVANIDLESLYPGFHSMPNANAGIEETDTTYNFIVSFRDLDLAENLQAMHQAGLITLEDPENQVALTVDSLFDGLTNEGFEPLDEESYESLNINTTLG